MKTGLKVWLRLLATALTVLLVSGCGLFLQRDREGFFFAGQEGDDSVLEHVSVTGVLSDAFHSVSFASRGAGFTHETQRQVLFAASDFPAYRHQVNYSFEPLPGTKVTRETTVSTDVEAGNPAGSFSPVEQQALLETADQFMLCLSNTSNPSYRPYRVKTQVVYQKRLTVQYPVLNGDKEDIPHILDLPAGSVLNEEERFSNAVQLKERCYAITPTDAYCRGTGGIYDLTEQVALPLWSENQPPVTELKNLYPIDLGSGKNEILAMEACGNSLAVFIRVDGTLTMRLVDPQTWKTQRIIALPGWEQIPMYESFHVKGDYAVLVGWQEQELLDPSAGGDSELSEPVRQCDVIDLKGGAVAERVRDNLASLTEGSLTRNIEDALYVNNTLYLLTYLVGEPIEAHQQRPQESVRRQEWPCLLAYRGGRRVFTCAVSSGQQEDIRAQAPLVRRYQALQLQAEEVSS